MTHMSKYEANVCILHSGKLTTGHIANLLGLIGLSLGFWMFSADYFRWHFMITTTLDHGKVVMTTPSSEPIALTRNTVFGPENKSNIASLCGPTVMES